VSGLLTQQGVVDCILCLVMTAIGSQVLHCTHLTALLPCWDAYIWCSHPTIAAPVSDKQLLALQIPLAQLSSEPHPRQAEAEESCFVRHPGPDPVVHSGGYRVSIPILGGQH